MALIKPRYTGTVWNANRPRPGIIIHIPE